VATGANSKTISPTTTNIDKTLFMKHPFHHTQGSKLGPPPTYPFSIL
jgi:hypothetical protein